MLKRFISFLLVLVLFVSALYLFRAPILNCGYNFLVREDSLQKADAMFVLSGNGYVRGNEAAKIYRAGYCDKIVCTGGNLFIELLALGIDTLESDLTVANLHRWGISDSVIVKLREGTSTREEAVIILNYCLQNNLKRVIVISSLTHTRRVNSVFRKQFNDAGIELIIRGARKEVKSLPWWHDEESLIEVNNEWIKTFYYWWKYNY